MTPSASTALLPNVWKGNVGTGDILDANFTALPPTAARANSYDLDWKDAWVAHARSLLATAKQKTPGFVLHIGDSISYGQWNATWPRQGAGKTVDDARVTTWVRADEWTAGAPDVLSRNGWYLATTGITDRRSFTAGGGLRPNSLVSGCCNDGPDMPAIADPAVARAVLADPGYVATLQIDTIAAACGDAQFAVVMMGTNDAGDAYSLTNMALIACIAELMPRIRHS